jgi:ribonucleoside-diphosphate reductase alpha chain
LSPDPALAMAVKNIWDKAYALGKEQGFRHCHLTGLATPLAVQGILGTTARDVAPEAGLIRFEGFFGDGVDSAALYGKKINPAVMQGLKRLGYSIAQIEDIYAYVVGHGTLLDAPAINHETLAAKGLSVEAIAAVEKALPAAQHIGYAFNRWTLGAAFDDFVVYNDDFLAALGFDEDDIDAANLYACGALTIEGAPHLSPDHLAVFDCLLPGGFGVRRVSAEAQIRMQAAVEPFLSGAVSQTLSLDHHVGIEDVQRLILLGWELGVKRLSLWREGASLLHPANLLPQKWETSLFAEEEEDRAREQRAARRKTAG